MAIVLFILILAVLIIAHEFGHYLMARAWKTRVDEFGIGLPPKAKTIGKKWGTEFTLNWLPFGGFVKIFGENGEETDSAPPKDSFVAKPKIAQALILFAGPLANALIAWLLFSVMFMAGTTTVYEPSLDAYFTETDLAIVEVLDDSPAEEAGFQSGDIVYSVFSGGEELTDFQPEAFSEFISSAGQNSILVTVERDSEFVPLEVTASEGAVGVAVSSVGEMKLPFFRALWQGLRYTGIIIEQMVTVLISLIGGAFNGTADFSSVVGPVGVVDLFSSTAKQSAQAVLSFIALISANLAIINLIPFPALDGGRILFVIIEAVTRKRIPEKVAGIVNTVGFGILILLTLVVTYNDILRLFV